MTKLTDFTNLSIHKITGDAERNALHFSQVIRRNSKLLDGFAKKLEQMEFSIGAFEMLRSAAQSYTRMTNQLKNVVRQLHKHQAVGKTHREKLGKFVSFKKNVSVKNLHQDTVFPF
jgi:hypothetical protein